MSEEHKRAEKTERVERVENDDPAAMPKVGQDPWKGEKVTEERTETVTEKEVENDDDDE